MISYPPVTDIFCLIDEFPKTMSYKRFTKLMPIVLKFNPDYALKNLLRL